MDHWGGPAYYYQGRKRVHKKLFAEMDPTICSHLFPISQSSGTPTPTVSMYPICANSP